MTPDLNTPVDICELSFMMRVQPVNDLSSLFQTLYKLTMGDLSIGLQLLYSASSWASYLPMVFSTPQICLFKSKSFQALESPGSDGSASTALLSRGGKLVWFSPALYIGRASSRASSTLISAIFKGSPKLADVDFMNELCSDDFG